MKEKKLVMEHPYRGDLKIIEHVSRYAAMQLRVAEIREAPYKPDENSEFHDGFNGAFHQSRRGAIIYAGNNPVFGNLTGHLMVSDGTVTCYSTSEGNKIGMPVGVSNCLIPKIPATHIVGEIKGTLVSKLIVYSVWYYMQYIVEYVNEIGLGVLDLHKKDLEALNDWTIWRALEYCDDEE